MPTLTNLFYSLLAFFFVVFCSHSDDHIQTMSLSVLVLAHIAGLALKVNIANEDAYNILVFDAILIGLPIVAFAAGLYMTIYESIFLPCKERKDKSKDGKKKVDKIFLTNSTKVAPIAFNKQGQDKE
jgi:hypothetical protein